MHGTNPQIDPARLGGHRVDLFFKISKQHKIVVPVDRSCKPTYTQQQRCVVAHIFEPHIKPFRGGRFSGQLVVRQCFTYTRPVGSISPVFRILGFLPRCGDFSFSSLFCCPTNPCPFLLPFGFVYCSSQLLWRKKSTNCEPDSAGAHPFIQPWCKTPPCS